VLKAANSSTYLGVTFAGAKDESLPVDSHPSNWQLDQDEVRIFTALRKPYF